MSKSNKSHSNPVVNKVAQSTKETARVEPLTRWQVHVIVVPKKSAEQDRVDCPVVKFGVLAQHAGHAVMRACHAFQDCGVRITDDCFPVCTKVITQVDGEEREIAIGRPSALAHLRTVDHTEEFTFQEKGYHEHEINNPKNGG